ncbi:hypothetical protein LCGC14_2968200 [marine sediment metagenome]|uniref:DUF5615 domain-containing protein n=1 Tax=marine sediment metagenome TaxID=412755 RepID=A0A0F8ZHX9_9ZZZZ
MKILLDMNLSPSWVPLLEKNGFEVKHWSDVGKIDAPDKEIFNWALSNGYIIFTHDLDFGAMLALTNAVGPSVIQVRTQDVTPGHLGKIVTSVLKQYQENLGRNAIIIVDEHKLRVKILPLKV